MGEGRTGTPGRLRGLGCWRGWRARHVLQSSSRHSLSLAACTQRLQALMAVLQHARVPGAGGGHPLHTSMPFFRSRVICSSSSSPCSPGFSATSWSSALPRLRPVVLGGLPLPPPAAATAPPPSKPWRRGACTAAVRVQTP